MQSNENQDSAVQGVESPRPALHKIFCFNNGGARGWMYAVAIGDDGHCLAQHVCSSEDFMPHDLGITSNWKHENYNKHFGEGNWELEWVSNPKNHAGLDAALVLNQQLATEAQRSSELKGSSPKD